MRSFVDLVSNESFIADFNLAEYLEWSNRRKVDGSKVLANFLHEYTHHWCFNSIVGNALTLLYLRNGDKQGQEELFFNDAIKFYSTCKILEPLAEGISLFAEFDAYPGESSIQSQALFQTMLYFAPAIDTNNRPEILLMGLLQNLRRDPDILERKAGIYAKTGYDPYSLGYISVKSLWSALVSVCDRFLDKDLFFAYLRSYIYDDPGLAIKVLKQIKEDDFTYGCKQITNYLSNRIDKLISEKDISEKVDNWQKSVLSGVLDYYSINSNDKVFLQYQDALNISIEGVKNKKYQRWLYWTLEERSLFLFGSIKVKIQYEDNGLAKIIAPELDLILYELKEPLLKDLDEAHLYMVGKTIGYAQFSLISNDNNPILVSSFGEFSDYELNIAKCIVIKKGTSPSILQMIRDMEGPVIERSLKSMEKFFIEPFFDRFYGFLSTLNSENHEWEYAFEKLLEEGIFGILNNDAELTRAYAAIGLMNSFTTSIMFIKAYSPLMDFEPEKIDEVLKLNSNFGFKLLAASYDDAVAFS